MRLGRFTTVATQSSHQHADASLTPTPTRFVRMAFAAWGLALFSGLLAITAYASRPGQQGVANPVWPKDSLINRSSASPTVVLFLHPKCPCSRSTVRELEAALEGCGAVVNLQVGFYCPTSETDQWTRTDLRAFVEYLCPGCSFVDHAGHEAHLFAAKTSGHTAVYSHSGKRLFSGGITSSRGHEGANFGSEAMMAAIDGRTVVHQETPVFGCPIDDTPLNEAPN